jgi:hypothetical protein
MRPLVWVIAGMGCAIVAAPFAASARPKPVEVKVPASPDVLERSFLMMDMARPTFTVPVPGFQRATLDDFTTSPHFKGDDHTARMIGGPFEMSAYRGMPLDPVSLGLNAKVSGEGPMVWRTGGQRSDQGRGR